MKQLAVTKYKCPECKNKTSYVEWADKDRSIIYELICDNCKPYHLPLVISKPVWIAESERILNKRRDDDPNLESTAAGVYQELREKEMRVSRKSKEWEDSRKKELAKYKPEWVKKGRNTKELPVITKV